MKAGEKVKKTIVRAVPFLLVLLLVLLCVFYPEGEKAEIKRRVVCVWNVDTFEGGKGSRTSFLKSVARRVEKEREGVYFLVSSYTAEGARRAFSEGKAPDILSFGVGLSEFAERSLPLPYSFEGGKLGGKTLAYPWCAGGYYLFSLTDDFQEEGKVALSCGGSNLPQVAAALEGLEGEELPALTAYTCFLQGKYRYLLGTQRDVCRFSARGTSFFSRPLEAFCDLYQYLSVLSARHWDDCLAFLEELLSKETKEKLSEIGMRPAEETARCTAGAFLSEAGRGELLALAREQKNLEKYLKTI